ncbi:MAG TPA: hypothetical protein VFA41_05255 [Ktedonobacteraceae bacterium]|jgi:hypothetical protein|nr:hypothetical protein [Ktedonobacteraceae bacterium]
MTRHPKRKQQNTLPVTLFTPETLSLTQQALAIFEEYLQRTSAAIVNRQLARETLSSLKHKLAILSASSVDSPALAFDRNEVVILSCPLQMYMLACAFTPDAPRKREEMRECRNLLHYFHSLLFI